MKIHLKMTGCRNNRYELDQIQSWATNHNVSIVPENDADFVIINTCTVTHVADRKSRQMIRKTKSKNPKLKTIVFGCGARMQKHEFNKIDEIDYLFTTWGEVTTFLVNHIQDSNEHITPLTDIRSRALVQIQDGCDNYCTYCIIAAARGKSTNHDKKDILEQVKSHVKNGYHEIVITGINIGAYGASVTTKPEESKLTDLLQEMLLKTKIDQIRLSSMGPEFFAQDTGHRTQDTAKKTTLFEVLQNPRICRHIHLSIQSGSDEILKRMKRNYSVEHLEYVIQRLKNNIQGIAITTDIIIGFPGETDDEFKQTYDFVRRNPLAKAHIFPYSIREGTLAAKMIQVPDKIKKERCKKLKILTDRQREDFINSQIGERVAIIWEKELSDGRMEGLTDNYIRVIKKSSEKNMSLSHEVLKQDML